MDWIQNLIIFMISLQTPLHNLTLQQLLKPRIKMINSIYTSNVSIEGYMEFYTPSHYNTGGAALYVKENYDIFERSDLKTRNDCFESVWVEIKNKRNIIYYVVVVYTGILSMIFQNL